MIHASTLITVGRLIFISFFSVGEREVLTAMQIDMHRVEKESQKQIAQTAMTTASIHSNQLSYICLLLH